jgi:hypothetical protein
MRLAFPGLSDVEAVPSLLVRLRFALALTLAFTCVDPEEEALELGSGGGRRRTRCWAWAVVRVIMIGLVSDQSLSLGISKGVCHVATSVFLVEVDLVRWNCCVLTS